MSELGTALTGANLADRIAVTCVDGGLDFKFIDEIKVSDDRFIVRTQDKNGAAVEETVVIMEYGQWKIAFLGK